jgi:subtilisin family serine protease
MSEDDLRPRPSFVVITAASDVDRLTLEAKLNIWRRECGPALLPLGKNRFVVSRPATKLMLAGENWNSLRRRLKKMREIIREVRLDGADAVLADYRDRPLSSPQRNSRGGEFWKPGECWALEDVRDRNRATVTELTRQIRLAHLDTGYTKHPMFGFRSEGDASNNGCDNECDAARLKLGSETDGPVLAVDEGVNYLDRGELLPLEALSHPGSPAHGTETLSLIVPAVRNHSFRGVDARCTIIPYRVTDSAAIDTSDGKLALERAVRHAVFDAACDVICIPLGDPCPPPSSLAEQIDAAYDAGVIIVAAAGEISGEVAYPGRYRRVITVSGTTRCDHPWLSAARGRAVDICAPATGIVAATAGLVDGEPCYHCRQVDGTSYAAAVVAGAAVLWLARQSGWPHHDWRLVEAFRTCLTESARHPAGWDDRLWGAGILDPSKLLDQRLPDPAALSAVPAAAAQKW